MVDRFYNHIKPFESGGTNVTRKWRKWKEDFLDFIEVNNLNDPAVTEKKKISHFRLMCGEELLTKLGTLNVDTSAEDAKLDDIIKKLNEAYKNSSNPVFASYQFWSPSLKQEEGESFDCFSKRVKEAAIDCEFGTSLARNIRDKLVIGITNVALRERLLREKDLTEQKVIEQCLIVEQSQLQVKAMSSEVQVDAIKRQSIKQESPEAFKCRNCGEKHPRKQCPAFRKQCSACKKMNHFEKVCRSKNLRVDEITEFSSYENDLFYIDEITIDELKKTDKDSSEWLLDVKMNNCALMNCKIDTGAQANVMSTKRFNLLPRRPALKKTDVILKGYGGNIIDLIGECIIPVELNNICKNVRFFVTKVDAKTILGLRACREFQLIRSIAEIQMKTTISTPEEAVKRFSDVFEGNGSLKPVKIILSENAVPHVSHPRKLPIALQEPVKNELDNMVKEGIIVKVDQPTDWVNNFHPINKSGKLRIVLDPRPLNKFIKRAHFHIPTLDELLLKLNGCTIFTVFDAKRAFWQQPLDEESSYLTTFITPHGRYRFLKVPYGIVNAPENFQSAMHEIFKDIPNVEPYFDDIVIGSKTMEEHIDLITRVLSAARKNNLKFNAEKIQLAKSDITYLGHTLSSKGLSPSQSKVKAINEYPTPQNKDDLHRFLSMYKYHNRFIENASHKSHTLRLLLKKDATWVWDNNTQQCFESLKNDLATAPVLQLFDPKKETSLSVDASGYGLGAVLLQEGKPIAFASASLNSTQQRYAQIEKELLSVVFGLKHFHFYTYGRKVFVENDHKPLIGLKEKPFESISPRLQRLLFKTLMYDYELKYVPGKELIAADALSRAPQTEQFLLNEIDEPTKLEVNILTRASDRRWEMLKSQTADDEDLKILIDYLTNGWPSNTKSIPSNIKPFWSFREELYLAEGLVCRGERLVIPKKSRQAILVQLHDGHNGVSETKVLAREFFYWTRMDNDIERFAESCDYCQELMKSNSPEPMKERQLATRPWELLGADFFDEAGKKYLLVIDSFSKYVELEEMKGNEHNAEIVINVFKRLYSHHGFPDEVITDRGPPFYSKKFKQYHESLGIALNPSTPGYPKSNGLSERCVQTIKRSLKKSLKEGKDIFTVALNYNTTPRNGLKSPSELLFGRKLKTSLLVLPSHLKPNFPIVDTIQQLTKNQQTQKTYHDRNAKTLSDLSVNDSVWFQKSKGSNWFKGIVIEANNEYRSYTIKSENSRIYVRNRVFIRLNKSQSKINIQPEIVNTAEDLYDLVEPQDPDLDNSIYFEAEDDNADSSTDQLSEESCIGFTTELEAPAEFSSIEEQLPSTRSGRAVSLPSRLKDFQLF